MIIVLVIFLIIVIGFVGMGMLKGVGLVVGKVFVYFFIFLMLVLIVGLIVVNVVYFGLGMNIDLVMLDVSKVVIYIEKVYEILFIGFVMDIILMMLVLVFVEGNIL